MASILFHSFSIIDNFKHAEEELIEGQATKYPQASFNSACVYLDSSLTPTAKDYFEENSRGHSISSINIPI